MIDSDSCRRVAAWSTVDHGQAAKGWTTTDSAVTTGSAVTSDSTANAEPATPTITAS